MTTLQSSPRMSHRRDSVAILVATMIAIAVAVVLALSLTASGVSHGRPTPRIHPTVSHSSAGHQGVVTMPDRSHRGSSTGTMLPSAQPAPCTTDNCRNRR
jgi:hypothetical protein